MRFGMPRTVRGSSVSARVVIWDVAEEFLEHQFLKMLENAFSCNRYLIFVSCINNRFPIRRLSNHLESCHCRTCGIRERVCFCGKTLEFLHFLKHGCLVNFAKGEM